MIESKICEHCGASMKAYWHKLTPGLVKTLEKVYKRVVEKQENIFQENELDLNHSEYGNFQKLRFHALIAKLRKDGVVISRNWVITKRGAQFLKGAISVPAKVRTFRNKVVSHSEEQVNITEVMRGDEDFQIMEEFRDQLTLIEFAEPEQDIDSLEAVKKIKKKKGKIYCSRCDTQMKTGFDITNIDDIKIKVTKYLKCPKCGLKEITT